MNATRADAMPIGELHRALWAKVAYTIHCTVSGEAGGQVLAMYLDMSADDGFADGTWHTTRDALCFSFGDAAGLCTMSSAAALHWLEVVLATDSMVKDVVLRAGWELADLPVVPALGKALAAHGPALVEVRETLYAVTRAAAGHRLADDDFVTDDGLPRLRLAELNEDERAAVEAAAYAGVCNCEYCRNVLPFVWLPEWQEGERADVGRAWSALDELATEAAAARSAVLELSDDAWRAAPRGPVALEALVAALSDRGLRPPLACVVPMLLGRGR